MEGEDWHQQQLNCHCRVCGNRLRKAKSGNACREYSCSSVTSQLQRAFGVDMAGDDAHTHPTHMCQQCHNAVQKCILADSKGKASTSTVSVFKWKAHKESCEVSFLVTYFTKALSCNIRASFVYSVLYCMLHAAVLHYAHTGACSIFLVGMFRTIIYQCL